MFEKSLYDLIRGLRNHRGTEKEYIQSSIRECRKEIKSLDMDMKATALMKLTYLEMFGHDMSWASFNVLEVMSSPKYHQKRIGYLAGVQSFRPDTEVLMLAENLLKKDLMSPQPIVTALPLAAIPHVVNPPMANSLLSELLSRLNHSNSNPLVRKKTIVTLYRLALVLPETLRPAWPKIKERLLDENEDSSVTAAVVNVVCELGWRRPRDFLPLAPRLFDLLLQTNNNWMAIKIIKLFATLTPLEPRLIKKLLPPLTDIIKTTPAMSLLYECISGIIQGGILASVEGTIEGEEIARLCVTKLRGMLVIEGDPNLKYVALLAFNEIVQSHPHLISQQQDAILECVDDPDISIRTKALDLVVGMVNSENLTAIVGRLMRQLRNAPIDTTTKQQVAATASQSVVPTADFDDEDPEESLRRHEIISNKPPPLPEDYRIAAIRRILQMCSRDTYSNINDFDWYIDVLVQLVRVSPSRRSTFGDDHSRSDALPSRERDVSYEIGNELQSVAVRVKSVRPEATEAAQSLLLVEKRDQMFPSSGNGGQGVLAAAAWIVGEYAELLTNPHGVMSSLMHDSVVHLPPHMLAVYIQALVKVLASLTSDERISWTPERKSMVSVLLDRIVHFLEPLATHSSLEVQERVAEYLELTKLAAEAVSGHAATERDMGYTEPPLLLTQAIPSLFCGLELNPVAPTAQRKVKLPEELDLDTPINPNLQSLLVNANRASLYDIDEDPIYRLYYNRSHLSMATSTTTQPESMAVSDRLNAAASSKPTPSYQQSSEPDYLDPDILARRKAERRERNRDDPFYIGDPSLESAGDPESGPSTPLHNILKNSNGDDVDIDAIPIMDLDLGSKDAGQQTQRPTVGHRHGNSSGSAAMASTSARRQRRNVEIMVDETVGGGDSDLVTARSSQPMLGLRPDLVASAQSRAKKSLLQVDSSGLGSLSLDDGPVTGNSRLDIERRQAEEVEMARLMKEVERARLEMQRAQERIQAKEGEEEGVVVKRKKKKKKLFLEEAVAQGEEALPEVRVENSGLVMDEGEAAVKKKKKKKKGKKEAVGDAEGEAVVKKKKKKRQPALPASNAEASLL